MRAGGRVEHDAPVVAYGVDASGQREVIGLDVGAAETEAFWREFYRSLVRVPHQPDPDNRRDDMCRDLLRLKHR